MIALQRNSLPLSVNWSHISSSLLSLSSHPVPAPLIHYTIFGAIYTYLYVCMYFPTSVLPNLCCLMYFFLSHFRMSFHTLNSIGYYAVKHRVIYDQPVTVPCRSSPVCATCDLLSVYITHFLDWLDLSTSVLSTSITTLERLPTKPFTGKLVTLSLSSQTGGTSTHVGSYFS